MKQISKEDFNLIFPIIEKYYNGSKFTEKGWRKTVHHVFVQDNLLYLIDKVKKQKK